MIFWKTKISPNFSEGQSSFKLVKLENGQYDFARCFKNRKKEIWWSNVQMQNLKIIAWADLPKPFKHGEISPESVWAYVGFSKPVFSFLTGESETLLVTDHKGIVVQLAKLIVKNQVYKWYDSNNREITVEAWMYIPSFCGE